MVGDSWLTWEFGGSRVDEDWLDVARDWANAKVSRGNVIWVVKDWAANWAVKD